MTKLIQLLVADWLTGVWWAELWSSGRNNLMAARDPSNSSEDADLPPGHLFFVHLHRLQTKMEVRETTAGTPSPSHRASKWITKSTINTISDL